MLFVLMIMCAALPFSAGLSAGEGLLTISAEYSKNAPLSLDDPIWQKVQPVQVPVEGRESLGGAKGVVSTRAIYTDERIYFLLRWEDPTMSVTKASWVYDGQKWSHQQGDEDRISLLFEITRIEKFSSRGCAVTCHSPPDAPRESWKLATRTAAEKGDLWHWKAARSAPYHHADDSWLTVAGNPSGSYRETGRRSDPGKGGDVKNETEDGTRPLYMQDPRKTPTAPGFLLMEEAIKIQDYALFNAGDVIPYRLPVKPGGSRFDVRAESRHSGGYWTVMLYRNLDTGHEDDVVFNPSKRYSFAMAVFDDSGADHSKATKAMVLTFRK